MTLIEFQHGLFFLSVWCALFAAVYIFCLIVVEGYVLIYSLKDQEKVAIQQKSAKEAEQERQWKQLQALRQQQAQQQQHVIHEQRVQGTSYILVLFWSTINPR